MSLPMVLIQTVTVFLIVLTAPSMTLHCLATSTMILMGMDMEAIAIITDVIPQQAW